MIFILFIEMLLISWKFGKIQQELVADVDKSLSLPGMLATFIPFRRDPLVLEDTRDGIPAFLSSEKPAAKPRKGSSR